MTEVVETPRSEPRSHGYPTCASHPTEHVVAGAKLETLYGVDVSGIDPVLSVALTEAILADAAKSKPVETGRRVIITWPKAGHATVLANATMCVNDAETGEEFVDGTAMTMRLGEPGNWTHQVIEVDICRLTAPDGEPLGPGRPVPVDDEITYAWFRYAVAEMRIAES